MELGQSVVVRFTQGKDEFIHHLRPMTNEEFIQYSGDVGRGQKFTHRKKTIESSGDLQKQNKEKLKWWGRLVERVEGYEAPKSLGGGDVMARPEWRDLILQYASAHCVIAVSQMDAVELEDTDEGPLPEENSAPVSGGD